MTDRRLNPGPLVLASHNAGKLAELEDLIGPLGFEVTSAAALDLPEPEETGDTFEANALLKARAAAEATHLPALADDSGLAVVALDGAPGIYSARWAGPDRDFAMAMRTIEEKLSAKVGASRQAKFVSVLALVWPDGAHRLFYGEVTGELVWPPRGTGGFGYDPMFRPETAEQTFGEMSATEKKQLSHRARAFQKLLEDGLNAG